MAPRFENEGGGEGVLAGHWEMAGQGRRGGGVGGPGEEGVPGCGENLAGQYHCLIVGGFGIF